MTKARTAIILLPLLLILPLSQPFAKEVRKMTMKITSPEFVHGKAIPARFGCDDQDVSPPLAIAGVPAEAKSLALVMDDPDAPAGVWVHWVLWNIDPGTKQIAAGSVPPGAQLGMNSWKRTRYNGPCPPSGTHRYFFRLYALNERLNLPASATRKELDRAMHGKIVAQAELMGVYGRR